ncbi:hypothetical protein BC829DRAFT_431025 [Chytridium lagenaria]|nr:hypothetical protein BC829DRAFT_431025 [Chytridium lagenaria]
MKARAIHPASSGKMPMENARWLFTRTGAVGAFSRTLLKWSVGMRYFATRGRMTLSQFKRSPMRLLNRYMDEGTVLWGLIGANTLVFAGWTWAQMQADHGKPQWRWFMEDNFYSSWQSVREGRFWTMFTSCFSHNTLLHFGLNMFVLHSFGPAAMSIIGPRNFILFYLAAGASASIAHMLYAQVIRPRIDRANGIPGWRSHNPARSHGSSGSIAAATLLFALTYPKHPITLFFFIPVPALVGIGGFLCYDIYMASSGRQGMVDSGGSCRWSGVWDALLRKFMEIDFDKKTNQHSQMTVPEEVVVVTKDDGSDKDEDEDMEYGEELEAFGYMPLGDGDEGGEGEGLDGMENENEENGADENMESLPPPPVFHVDAMEKMSDEHLNAIQNVMASFTLSDKAIPDWAKAIPESSWLPVVVEKGPVASASEEQTKE